MTLGAGRWRIVRQLMTESILLSLAGAAAGCFFASAALEGLIALIPLYTFPDEAIISINREVLLATVGVAIATAFVFGLAPALAASRGDLNESLRNGARGNTGFRRGRMRYALVAGEVTLSMLLLTGSGLLMRTFFLERQIDLGIRSSHLLTTGLAFPAGRYRNTDSEARFLRELLPRLESLRGVISAAVSRLSPERRQRHRIRCAGGYARRALEGQLCPVQPPILPNDRSASADRPAAHGG
jgi:putative ABC transport system permease protein